MRKFGLIGFPLTHSFSKKYFTEKFGKENIPGCEYELYEVAKSSELEQFFDEHSFIEGFSVTIPYKQDVIPLMHELDEACEAIGAVNCIKISDGKRKGFNTDYLGFKESLRNWLGDKHPQALVLGTGGASKAVRQALKHLNINFLSVSRSSGPEQITYSDLSTDPSILQEYKLIVNTTPLGTYPNVEGIPAIPVEQLGAGHMVYDLVYNPAETALMKACIAQGGSAMNGLEMLTLQAEAAWEIWNS